MLWNYNKLRKNIIYILETFLYLHKFINLTFNIPHYWKKLIYYTLQKWHLFSIYMDKMPLSMREDVTNN